MNGNDHRARNVPVAGRRLAGAPVARRGILSAVLAVLALFCSTAGADAQQRMFEKRTTHYHVATDISPQFTNVVAAHMEEIFKEYSRRFKGYGTVDKRFEVAVFGTEAAYLRRFPQVQGSAGVFISRLRTLAAHADGRTTEEVLRTLYHEGFHQFMWEVISKDCPIWLNEGIAEYFHSATWNGHSFSTGQVPTKRAIILTQMLKQTGHIPFEQLFAMDDRQWLNNVRANPRMAMIQYVESWSIVHFLLHAQRGRYNPMLINYLKAIDAGKDSREAFTAVFGQDMASFERAWRQYAASLKPSPKYVCRDNMASILMLALSYYGNPQRLTSVEKLREEAVDSGQYRWRVVQPSGRVISSTDEDAAAGLFSCPPGSRRKGTNYLLVRDPATNLPVLVCMQHKGIVIKAYYVRNPDGSYGARTEEVVRELVPDGMKRAITAASRD